MKDAKNDKCQFRGCSSTAEPGGFCLIHTQDKAGRADAFWELVRARLAGVGDSADLSRYVFPKCEFDLTQLLPVDGVATGRVSLAKAVKFDGAIFLGAAKFASLGFPYGASFRGVQFLAGADFRGSEFLGGADFGRTPEGGATVFGAGSAFDKCAFHGTISFRDAEFNGTASFSEAEFHAAPSFEGAKFSRVAEFKKVWFHLGARFVATHFSEWVNLTEIRIDEGEVLFQIGTTEVFSKGAAISTGESSGNGSITLSGIGLSRTQLRGCDPAHLKLRHVKWARARKMILLQRIALYDEEVLVKRVSPWWRLVSGPRLAKGLEWLETRCSPSAAHADEIAQPEDAGLARQVLVGCLQRGVEKAQRWVERGENHTEIVESIEQAIMDTEQMYTHLARACEARSDTESAGAFRWGAFETSRLRAGISRRGAQAGRLRWLPTAFLSRLLAGATWYKYFAAYGESSVYSVAVLALLWFLLGSLLMRVGHFAGSSEPFSVWLLRAGEAMIWRLQQATPATLASNAHAELTYRFLVLAASVFGPVQGALLVFAVRRKLRRTEHDFD